VVSGEVKVEVEPAIGAIMLVLRRMYVVVEGMPGGGGRWLVRRLR